MPDEIPLPDLEQGDAPTVGKPVHSANINGPPQRCTRHENTHQSQSILLVCQRIKPRKAVGLASEVLPSNASPSQN